jgi:hypothetical protein
MSAPIALVHEGFRGNPDIKKPQRGLLSTLRLLRCLVWPHARLLARFGFVAR